MIINLSCAHLPEEEVKRLEPPEPVVSPRPTSLDEIPSLSERVRLYTVKKGDTLWDISQKYMDSSWGWPEIWKRNVQVENPHVISPGDRLYIPMTSGGEDTELPVVKLTPQYGEGTPMEYVLTDLLRKEDIIFGRGRSAGFLSVDEFKGAARIIESREPRDMLALSDTVFVNRGTNFGVALGDRMTIFRIGEEVEHPITGDDIGYKIEILGLLEVVEVEKEVSTGLIVVSYDYILRGDLVEDLKTPEPIIRYVPGPTGLKGYIVAIKENIAFFGQSDIVYIDKGIDHGVRAGNIFKIIRPGQKVGKLLTPSQIIGELVVIDPHDKVSTTLIIRSSDVLKIGEMIEIR